MNRISFALILCILILSLSACSVNTISSKERILDTIEKSEFPVMYIESDIPQGANLCLSREDGRFAVFTHRDYEIIQEIFLADSTNDAFIHISGKTSAELKPILAGNFPFEKYRCTWTTAGESGTNLWQSVLFFDGTFYYSISVQCPVEKAGTYENEFSDLLSRAELCSISYY